MQRLIDLQMLELLILELGPFLMFYHKLEMCCFSSLASIFSNAFLMKKLSHSMMLHHIHIQTHSWQPVYSNMS